MLNSCHPLSPIGVSILRESLPSTRAQSYAHAQHIVVGLEEPRGLRPTIGWPERAGLCTILHTNFREFPSLLKNSLYARFDPRSGPKHTLFGPYWSFWSQIRSHFQLSADFFNRLSPSTHSGE